MREKVAFLVDVARENDLAVRIGVNCGSVDPEMKERHPDDDVQAMVESALEHCRYMDELGFDRYVVSLKDSHPRKVIEANRRFAEARPDVPLHLGVTEAGIPPEGVIKTRVAFEQLLSRGIGDTLRVSLTLPNPRKHEEVTVGLQILADVAAGRYRSVPVFDDDKLNIISCPSCSRVENERFVELAEKVKEMTAYAEKHALTIAVMGCRVNGPGETDDADLGLWCGPTHVNLKKRTASLGAFTYDEILARLKQELDAARSGCDAGQRGRSRCLPADSRSASTISFASSLKVTRRLPAELALRLARVAEEQVHLGRAEVLRVHLDEVLPVEADAAEGLLAELPDGVRLAGGDHVVPGLVALQHPPHGLDVVLRVAPVPLRVQVPEPQLLLPPLLDRRHAHRDLPGHEVLSAAGGLVVEEDAVRDVHPVALAVVHGHPVAVDLGDRVGRAGMEGRSLRLGGLLHQPEHLRAARLVDAGVEPEVAHRVEHAQDADRGDVRGVHRHVERDLHVALGGEVVDLVGVQRLEGAGEAVLVDQVAVVQDELVPDVVDPPGVEGAAAAHEPVHLVALLEQQLREVAAVLARDPGDERLLRCQMDPPQTPESTPWLARRSKPDRGRLKENGGLWEEKEEGPTHPTGASFLRDVVHRSRTRAPSKPCPTPVAPLRIAAASRPRRRSLLRLDPIARSGPGRRTLAYPALARVT